MRKSQSLSWLFDGVEYGRGQDTDWIHEPGVWTQLLTYLAACELGCLRTWLVDSTLWIWVAPAWPCKLHVDLARGSVLWRQL